MRNTIVVHGRLAMRGTRLRVARARAIGTQVLSIEHVAARLAGGFSEVVDMATLRAAVAKVLSGVDLGELEPIKALPGFPRAAAASLMKLWMSGIDTDAMTDARIAAMARLGNAVPAALPATMKPPHQIVAEALGRVRFAPAVLGPVRVEGMTELHPIWRDLLFAIAEHVPVTWAAGPREVPTWLAGTRIAVERSEPASPALYAVSCATARHEVIEAIRWARSLLSQNVPAHEIAVATTSTADYDDHFKALAGDAGLPIHFVHGIAAVHTADGQAAAALADILLRGLSQKRVRRLIDLIRRTSDALEKLPENWEDALPPDAALTTVERWKQAFRRRAWGEQVADIMMPVIELLSKGIPVAREAGERLLRGRALLIWERALVDGPASALDQTIESLRIDDDYEPFSSIAYMSAEALATMPRTHVRLLGLTSRAWPRGISEDGLIPDHVIPTRRLDPLPLAEQDRRDFATILATTSGSRSPRGVEISRGSVTLSWARRDAEGRKLGISPLVPKELAENPRHLRLTAKPHHAMSEADRLLARPEEFATTAHAISAIACWDDWHDTQITPHDGLVRANHPRILAALRRTHSATSLRKLLRDPLGFVWQYALGFAAPEFDDEPLTLDSRQFGNLLHEVLQRTVESLEEKGGLARVPVEVVRKTIEAHAVEAGTRFQVTHPVPPQLIWHATMSSVVAMAEAALFLDLEPLDGQVSYTEVPFGGGFENPRANAPWNPATVVHVPGTDIRIKGYIDRLDLSADGRTARVLDYKSGKVPKNIEQCRLLGGKEIQRCLYGFAVRALLGPEVSIESALIYPRGNVYARLENPDETLERLAGYVRTAADVIRSGKCLPGEDARDEFNDLMFALPANARSTYLKRKTLAIDTALGAAIEIWKEV